MRTTPNIQSEMDRARREMGEAFTGPSAATTPEKGKAPGVAAVDAGSAASEREDVAYQRGVMHGMAIMFVMTLLALAFAAYAIQPAR